MMVLFQELCYNGYCKSVQATVGVRFAYDKRYMTVERRAKDSLVGLSCYMGKMVMPFSFIKEGRFCE